MKRKTKAGEGEERRVTLAIDPGYGRMGVAVLERNNGKEALVFSECFETPADMNRPQRLAALQARLGELCDEHRPQELAIEKLFFSKNKKTALGVAEARGVIVSGAAVRGIRVFEYEPVQIKVAVTSYGKSDKKQVIAMVKRLMRMDKKARDDEYDAIAIGLTHLATSKRG